MKKALVFAFLVTGCAATPIAPDTPPMGNGALANDANSSRIAETPLSKEEAIEIIEKSFRGSTFSSIVASQQTIGEARQKPNVVIDEGYPDSAVVWVVTLSGDLVYQSAHGAAQDDGTISVPRFSSGIAIVDAQDGIIISTSLNP